MQHLTFKNVVIAFLLLNFATAVFSATAFPTITATRDGASGGSHPTGVVALKAEPRTQQAPQWPSPATHRPEVVKVLDLPDTEAFRYGETSFVDLGWRYTSDFGGEWVGYLGSDTEFLSLDDTQIAGIKQEANLKAFPRPPVPRVNTQPRPKREKPIVRSEPKPHGIGLIGWMSLLMSFAAMMYIRYRIMRVAVDATQGAAGFAKRAVIELLAARGQSATVAHGTSRRAAAPAKPAEHPVPVQVKAPKRSSTVVRASPGIFGLWPARR